MGKFKNVAVLMGGPRGGIDEGLTILRNHSLKSGMAIAAGLKEAGLEVIEVDITSTDFALPDNIEAVFIALVGEFGANGRVQKVLEERGIPFTGARAADLPTSFNKILGKKFMIKHGLPTPAYEIIEGPNPHISMPCPIVIKAPSQVHKTIIISGS